MILLGRFKPEILTIAQILLMVCLVTHKKRLTDIFKRLKTSFLAKVKKKKKVRKMLNIFECDQV